MVLLHRYVSDLLTFALHTASEYGTLEELIRFLTLPRERPDLERAIRVHRRAMKFRGYVARRESARVGTDSQSTTKHEDDGA